MAKQGINTGSSPNDGLGDSLLSGAIKINSNFTEIYNTFGNGTNLVSYANSSGTSSVSLGLTGSPDITVSKIIAGVTSSIIPFLWPTYSGLPSYSTYHGAVAHAHDTGKLYYAHTRWVELVNIELDRTVGTGTENYKVGVITASSFSGSGIGLTGIPAGQLTGALPAIDGSALTGIVASGSGVIVRDSGTVVGTAGTIDFGDNLTVSAVSAGVVTVTGSASGQSSQFVTTAAGIHTLSNVGIGTTNPTSALTVKGNTSLETLNVSGVSTFSNTIVVGSLAFGAGAVDVVDTLGGRTYISPGAIQFNSSGFSHLSFSGSQLTYRASTHYFSNYYGGFDHELVRINSSGINVTGVTTSTGGFVGNVTGNATGLSGTPNITVGTIGATSLNASGVSTLGTLNVGTGGTVITTTSAGLVGIGTTNPTSALTVQGDGTFTGVVTASSFSGAGTGLTSIPAAQLTGALPAIDGSALINVIGSGSGVIVKDSGTPVGTAGTIDFGDNLTVSPISAGVVTVTSSGGSSQFVTTAAGIHTLSNVGIGTTNPQTPLQVERYGVKTGLGTFNASAGIATDIDTFTISTTDFKTAEYTLHFIHSSNIQAQKVLVMQNGTTAYSQEYGVMSDPNLIVSVGATISSGVCKLQVTPEAGISGLTTYRFTRETML